MRRKDREITDFGEILAIAARCDVCNVAFADEGEPYVVPMNFGVTAGEDRVILWFHCASEGKKLDMLKKNHRVAFSMSAGHNLEWEESGHCTMRYESVCGSGRMTVADEGEKIAALDAIMDHYRPEHARKTLMEYPAATLARTTILKLEVVQMTGKRSAPKA